MVRIRIVVLVALALTLAACTAGQTVPPTTETGFGVLLSATPVGWVPVAYGDAQVSVPASFYVSYGAPDLYACQALDSPGALFVVPMHAKPIITEGGCPQPTRFSFPPTVVSLFRTHRPADVNKTLTTVNGLPLSTVYRCTWEEAAPRFTFTCPPWALNSAPRVCWHTGWSTR